MISFIVLEASLVSILITDLEGSSLCLVAPTLDSGLGM